MLQQRDPAWVSSNPTRKERKGVAGHGAFLYKTGTTQKCGFPPSGFLENTDLETQSKKARNRILTILLVFGGSFVVFFAYASFFEWALHKYFMHMTTWNYPFTAHALTHHGLFRADYSYHVQREEDREKVTFAWWNAPALLLVQSPLLFIAVYFFGWAAFWGGLVALASDYVLYEYLHWCMHVPQDRWFERTWVFRWLNAHHHMHHLYALKNLNVVLPLADWVMGTLIPTPAENPSFEQRKEAA
jgi:hypothetical protein